MASYIYSTSDFMIQGGGTLVGDLYGSTYDERVNSTPYKTVYRLVGTPRPDFEGARYIKGDAFYETSVGDETKSGAWFGVAAFKPYSSYPFFVRRWFDPNRP